MMKSEKDDDCLKIVLFPWLAHGHITPFLELAIGLCERNFICFICSTPINLTSIAGKIPPVHSSRLRLLHLHLPPSPLLPPHRHTTNGLPLHLQSALRKALRAAKPALADLISSAQPDLLIHDVMLPWAAAATSGPAVAFATYGAAPLSFFSHLSRRGGTEFPFAATLLKGFDLAAAFGNLESFRMDERESDDDGRIFRSRVGAVLVNSSREMEGKYLDYLSQLFDKRVEPIGTFIHDPHSAGIGEDDDAEIMEWLEQKQENSTVFVSFGSEYFLKREEIEAIANGLELSKVNFIWVIRFPNGEDMEVEAALPQGFLERVRERGKIVEKWAPQAKILGHRSVGGFVSHCGWNSCKESIHFGVPIIAMPMHLDQPLNANLMVELGVGVDVKKDEDLKYSEDEISRVVRDVVAGETGEALRRKVGEVRERARERSREEMDGVAHLLAELCGKE